MGEELLSGEDLMQAAAGSPARLPSGYLQTLDSESVVQAAVDAKDMSVPFVIVTRGAGFNRAGNKVQIVPGEYGQGLQSEDYVRNPIVLLDHGMGFSLPIAKSETRDGKSTLNLMATRAEARAYFSQSLPEAVQVFALIDEGILRTASIQFRPVKAIKMRWKPDEAKTTAKGEEIVNFWDLRMQYAGMACLDFVESTLLEWSVVSIPADTGAVRKCLDRGTIGTERITQSLVPMLQGMAGEKQVWAPGWTPAPVVLQFGELRVEAPTADDALRLIDVAQRIAVSRRQHATEGDEPARTPGAAAVASPEASASANDETPVSSAQPVAAEPVDTATTVNGVTTVSSADGEAKYVGVGREVGLINRAALAAVVQSQVAAAVQAAVTPLVSQTEGLRAELRRMTGRVD